jgi:hypothetical protein
MWTSSADECSNKHYIVAGGGGGAAAAVLLQGLTLLLGCRHVMPAVMLKALSCTGSW